MSKIIKACFVKQDYLNTPEYHQPYEQTLSKKKSRAEITKDTANSIYLETKMMIDELVTEAQKKAELIITGAEKKAEKTIEDSQLAYEKLKKKAYEEGLDAGYQEGIKKAEEETKLCLEQVKSLIVELKKSKEDFICTNMEEILDLVMTISEKILYTIVESKPEVICTIVKNVLATVAETENVIVKVNPIHLPYLDIFNEDFNEQISGKIKIEGESAIKAGSCVVVTEQGFIDAQIDEQLSLLKNALKEELQYA